MIKLIIISLLTLFSGNSNKSLEMHAMESKEVKHETWRISFSCGETCKKPGDCSLKAIDEPRAEGGRKLSCTCGECSMDIKSATGAKATPEQMSTAISHVVKKVNWKMLEVEMAQKAVSTPYKITKIDVALNHGTVQLHYTCQVEGADKDVVVMVIDRG